MREVQVLPAGTGDVFLDVRDGGRAMRVSWHLDDGLVVFSMWRGNVCVATFRLERQDVADLVQGLVQGLADTTTPTTSRKAS